MIIAVDLDGTLIRSDTLHELFLQLIKRNPLYLFLCVGWLLQGRAHLKRKIAERISLDAASLPYHAALLNWLKERKSQGDRLVLVTAADQSIADGVAQHLGIFEDAFGSNGQVNLKKEAKRDFLNAQYGPGQYAYIGNSTADLPVWKAAQFRGVVNASQALYQKVNSEQGVDLFFPRESIPLKKWLKLFRVHQYAKNLLIFLPWLLAHAYSDIPALVLSCLGFISFSLLASSVYITNDLLDLSADRRHHSKCRRAFAAGEVSIPMGIIMALICLFASIGLSYKMPWQFQIILAGYYVLTCAYSFFLKRQVLIDVYTLAILYTLRIFAGMAILGGAYSSWLTLFSFFFFTSLAFVKRFTELRGLPKESNKGLHGRGYHGDHLMICKIFGISSAFVSVMIFGLYLSSSKAFELYHHPNILYAICPVLLYWLSRIWLQASEGKVHDDPIVHALTDRVSYGVMLLIGVIAVIASI